MEKEYGNIFLNRNGKLVEGKKSIEELYPVEKSESSFVNQENKLNLKEDNLTEEMKNNYTFNYISKSIKRNIQEKNDLIEIIKTLSNISGLIYNISELKNHFKKEDKKNWQKNFEKEVEKINEYLQKMVNNEEKIDNYWNYIQTIK